jgi:hypothetical protein
MKPAAAAAPLRLVSATAGRFFLSLFKKKSKRTKPDRVAAAALLVFGV